MAKARPKLHAPPLPDQPLTFVCVDPSETRTGVTIGTAPAQLVMGDRIQTIASARSITSIASYTPKADGGFASAMAEVASRIPPGPWVPVIERPPPARYGDKASSLHAFKLWCEWADRTARERAKAAGAAYRKAADVLLDPMPSQWRQPQGLPTKAPDTIEAPWLRALWLKVQSMNHALRELERFAADPVLRRTAVEILAVVAAAEDRDKVLESKVVDHDAAESVCIYTWAVRNVGTIGTWFREDKPPRKLLALT